MKLYNNFFFILVFNAEKITESTCIEKEQVGRQAGNWFSFLLSSGEKRVYKDLANADNNSNNNKRWRPSSFL